MTNDFIAGLLLGVSFVVLGLLLFRDLVASRLFRAWSKYNGYLSGNPSDNATIKDVNTLMPNIINRVNESLETSLKEIATDLDSHINTIRKELYDEICEFINKELLNVQAQISIIVRKEMESTKKSNKERGK